MEITPQQKLEQFFAKSKPIFFKKNRTVLRSDELPTGAYYLEKGFIKDSSVSESGQEFTLFIFKKTDIFPYSWVFNEVPNEHSFIAMTDVVLLKRTREEFLEFLKNNPDILLMITQRVLKRLRGVMERLEYMVFGNAHARIASILNLLGERFGEETSEGIEITLPMSHKNVAELTGITRETASVELKKFENSGVLKHKAKHYVILKPEELKLLSNLHST